MIPYERADHQDIRALKIAIVNLMPDKITTETQILRLLSNTPLHVEIDLIQMNHISKNTPQEHMLKFYKPFEEIKNNRYDGLIITGAPVELMEYEEVDYWDELCEVFEWSKTHCYSTLHICWGAQAGLYYHYGICPHSRHTEVRREDIEKHRSLIICAESYEAGVHVVSDITERQFFVFGHWEYDRDTLSKEYFRDLNKGLDIQIPYNYFPDNDSKQTPIFNWSCSANLMYANWLNYCVYQQTPYDLDKIEPLTVTK